MQHLLLRATLINPVTSKPDDTLRHELVWGSGRLHNHYIPTTVVLPPRRPFVKQHRVRRLWPSRIECWLHRPPTHKRECTNIIGAAEKDGHPWRTAARVLDHVER